MVEHGKLKQEEEEEEQVAMESWEERPTPVHHTHTQICSHGELAEFGLDAAVPHAHPGES